MSTEEAIKSLEEADNKLKQAAALEIAVIQMQKEAARSRDESRDILVETVLEREKIESLQFVQGATLKQKEDELRNREVAILEERIDLAHQVAERTKELDVREASINAMSVTVDKGLRNNKENQEELLVLRGEYRSIADFIVKAL